MEKLGIEFCPPPNKHGEDDRPPKTNQTQLALTNLQTELYDNQYKVLISSYVLCSLLLILYILVLLRVIVRLRKI